MVVLVYNKSAPSRPDRHSAALAEASHDAESPSAPAASASDEVLRVWAQDPASLDTRAPARNQPETSSVAAGVHIYEGHSVSSTTGAAIAADTAEGAVAAEPMEISAEERLLLRDAEVGADQQAACRDTMLTLKEAFEGALTNQMRMDALRHKDRERLLKLEAQQRADQQRLAELLEQLNSNTSKQQIAELLAKIEEYKQREEDQMVEKWRERLLNNKGQFSLVMSLAREAHPIGALSKQHGEDSSAEASNTLSSSSAASRGKASSQPQGQGGSPATGPAVSEDGKGAIKGLTEHSDLAHFYDPSSESLSFNDALGSDLQSGSTSGTKSVGSTTSSGPPPHGQQRDASLKQASGSGFGLASVAEDSQKPSAHMPTHGSEYAAVVGAPAADQLQPGADQQEAAAGKSSTGDPALTCAVSLAKLSRQRTQPIIGAAATEAGGRTIGDNLTLSWVLQLWKHHIRSRHHSRTKDKGVSANIFCVVAEEQACQTDLTMTDWQRLQDELLDMKYDLKEADRLRLQAEEERDSLSGQLAEVNQKHSTEKDQLLHEISRIKKDYQNQLSLRDNEVKQLNAKLHSAQDALQRAQAEWENEKRALKATIREISSDLQQALSQARRMELLVQKLKKEGAGALKETIAQLIADLQAAKNKAAIACRERDQAVENSDMLNRKLGHTQRKMELERQFLPLIHLAKGPLSHQNRQINKTSTSKSEPKLPSLAQPEMLQ